MDVRRFYERTGGNYEEAMRRLLDEGRILRFIRLFPEDPSYDALTGALSAGDTDAAFRAAHALKGVCLTLSFDRMASLASEVTEVLRAGDLEKARIIFPALRESYEKVLAEMEDRAEAGGT